MEMFWKLWVALYTPRQTYHTFFINQALTTKKITTFSFIVNSFRRPPRLIFKYTFNDTANNRENLIHTCQAFSFGTHHPTSTHFEFQPQNNPSALNNNLKLSLTTFRRVQPHDERCNSNEIKHSTLQRIHALVQSIFWLNQHQHTSHRSFRSPQPPPSYFDTYFSWSNRRRCCFTGRWWKRLRFYDVSSTALPWHSKVWRFAIAHCLNLLERDLVQH